MEIKISVFSENFLSEDELLVLWIVNTFLFIANSVGRSYCPAWWTEDENWRSDNPATGCAFCRLWGFLFRAYWACTYPRQYHVHCGGDFSCMIPFLTLFLFQNYNAVAHILGCAWVRWHCRYWSY
jgi:hypothetical protein